MPVHNAEISEIFSEIADLLEISGANQFRVRAYRNAARVTGGMSRSLAELVKEEQDLSKLSGIGKDLAEKIEELVATGELKFLLKLRKKVPPALAAMMKLPGLGPKRVVLLSKKLKLKSLKDLELAAKNGKISQLDGFGKKIEENILDEIKRKKKTKDRISIVVADEVAESLMKFLKKIKGVKDAVVAGSYRRRRETVGDLDVVVTSNVSKEVIEKFIKYEDVRKVLAKGKTKSIVYLRSGLQVDLRVVPQESYGAALHYFTGSKAHVVEVRRLALKKKLKINEYGVYRGKKRIAGKTEEEVYKQVGLKYIEPEIRERRGEIEAARKNKLPKLVKLSDIQGNLHVHTSETDGSEKIETMVKAARDYGYKYIAITDHSQRVSVARGMDPKRALKHIKKIDVLDKKVSGIRVLKSIEVDILEDGTLDLPDEVLEKLDLTVCSIHYKFNLSRKKQTERIIKAMHNPYFNIMGHPSGRIIGKRGPYDFDWKKVMQAAKDQNCFLEVDSSPERLDLDDVHCKLAKEMGVKVSISTDAHSVDDYSLMKYGVDQARRGWLGKNNVINTRNLRDLKKLLKR